MVVPDYFGISLQAKSLGFYDCTTRSIREDVSGWEARIAERLAEQAKELLPWSENPAVPRNEPPIGARIWFTNLRKVRGHITGYSLQGAVMVHDTWGWVGKDEWYRWTWREMLQREDMLQSPQDFVVLPPVPAGSDVVWGG